MLFLLADNRCYRDCTAADEEQSDSQGKMTCVAGFGRSRFLLRQFCGYGVRFGDLLLCRRVGKILAAVIAAPVLDIALSALGGRFSVDMLHVGVITAIKFAVLRTADLAFRLICAGRLAAGVAADIAAFGACTVFPLVRFADHGYSAAAAPLLLVGGGRLHPALRPGVVIGIQSIIRRVASATDSLVRAGGRAAGVAQRVAGGKCLRTLNAAVPVL